MTLLAETPISSIARLCEVRGGAVAHLAVKYPLDWFPATLVSRDGKWVTIECEGQRYIVPSRDVRGLWRLAGPARVPSL